MCVNQCVCALRSGEQSSNSPQSSRVLPSMANIRSRGQKQKDAGPGFTKDSMAFQTLLDSDALKAHQPALSDTYYTIKTRNWSSMFPCTEMMRMWLQQRAQGSYYTDIPWYNPRIDNVPRKVREQIRTGKFEVGQKIRKIQKQIRRYTS